VKKMPEPTRVFARKIFSLSAEERKKKKTKHPFSYLMSSISLDPLLARKNSPKMKTVETTVEFPRDH
jgi:hypothetical protein